MKLNIIIAILFLIEAYFFIESYATLPSVQSFEEISADRKVWHLRGHLKYYEGFGNPETGVAEVYSIDSLHTDKQRRYALYMINIDPNLYKDQKIRIYMDIKTENVNRNGYKMIRTDSDNITQSQHQRRLIVPLKHYYTDSMDMVIGDDVKNIAYGVIFYETGTYYIKNTKIRVIN